MGFTPDLGEERSPGLEGSALKPTRGEYGLNGN